MIDCDILVIGAGSGGLAAAKKAASLGARVAIAESRSLGGTCVNRGCVPKKLLVNAAEFVRQQEVAASLHWVNPTGLLDWPSLQRAIAEHIQGIRQSQRESLESAGIQIIHGTARFQDEHHVVVDDQTIAAKHTVIAVGGAPTIPEIPGKALALTSQEMFHLSARPNHLAIVGGGYIGIEFAHILALLGTHVTLIDTDANVLAGFDSMLRDAVQAGLTRMGVEFIPEMTCKEIEREGEQLRLCLTGDDSEAKTITADQALLAVGRSPNLSPLNLEVAGVEVEEGKIVIDEHGQTSQPSIYAVGDCVGRMPLTPVAIAEGQAVAQTICQQPARVDYRWIPSAVFGMPTVATVGWSEAAAQQQLGEDAVTSIAQTFTPLKHSLRAEAQQSILKLVINRQTEQVLGVHMAGEHAAEIIQGLIPALQQGIDRQTLSRVIAIHPTSAEEIFSLSG